jgi:hypothetical protein
LQAVAYLGWLHSRILYAPESGAVSLPRNELEAPASLCHRHREFILYYLDCHD